MILELGTNLYHTAIFLIIAWAISRFLIALTKVPVTPKAKKDEQTGFTR